MDRSSLKLMLALMAVIASLLLERSLAEQGEGGASRAGAESASNLAGATTSTTTTGNAATGDLRAPFTVPVGYSWLPPQLAVEVVYDLWGAHYLPAPGYGLLVPVGVDLDSDEAWGLILAAAPSDLEPRLPHVEEVAPGTNVLGYALKPSSFLDGSSLVAPGVEAEWAVDLKHRNSRQLDYRALVKTAAGPMLVAAHIPRKLLEDVRAATLAIGATSEVTANESPAGRDVGRLL